MKKNIQELLEEIIRESFAGLGVSAAGIGEFYLDYPTDSRFGELSTNIPLRLSKLLKRKPYEIAGELIEVIRAGISEHGLADYIKEVKTEGAGFINFYLSDYYFYEQLKYILNEPDDALRLSLGQGRRVLLEFVSANPTGSLSVAHARQAAVGDVLANILSFCGFKAEKEFYLNDEGNQINILGDSVRLRIMELEGEKVDFPENYYQGSYIYDIARIAIEKKINQQDLGDFAADIILKVIKKELEDFGTQFDSWYSQKELARSGKVEAAIADLRKNSFIYEDEGATWFKSTGFGDDKDRVVIKSDGTYTYLAPDIAYHQDKYKRGFSWLINFWGPDHHGYINRLKASMQALGHPAETLSVVIVQLATIFRGKEVVHMSTRRGQYITLRQVLDEVGKDAARFFFLMRRTSSHLDFDLEVAKRQGAENPVYYVQYAHARISNIIRNSQLKADGSADFSLLRQPEELALAKKIWQFPSVLSSCVSTADPYMITVYLQELSESFHKFYDLHRVLGDNEQLTKARLGLIEAARITIAAGLGLLGISKPEKM